MSEKTEKPTPKRIRDARQEGQVAKSQEITALVQLSVILIWMLAAGPSLYGNLSEVVQVTIDVINWPIANAMAALAGVVKSLTINFVLILAVVLVPTLVLTGLLQTGFLFAPKALKPSAKRINILANAKQLVSLMKLFELFKMLVKVAILGITFVYLIKHYASSFGHLPQAAVTAGLLICCKLLLWMWSILLIVTAVFCAADYAMQVYQLRKQLMMSREDIKQEYKNSEGNPEVKHRRRELHREVQSGSLAKKVAKSSVVVRNPTHIAVCLRFAEGETPLPQVITHGRDKWALRIISMAEAQGIPVVENVPLARELYATTEPGDYIPESLFIAVAQVLRLVRHGMEDEPEDDEEEDDNDDANEDEKAHHDAP